jgi:nucleoside-diphosphate-sugar epimerase
MKTLVTGGAGFIGSHLVRRLVADGHDVTVLDDLSTGRLANIEDVDVRATLVGDVRAFGVCCDAVHGCDVVFHLAALGSVPRSVTDPLTTHDVNVTGTLNVLEAARRDGVERIIYASSSSVYGDQGGEPKHEHMCCEPTSPYGVSKLAAERYVSAFAKTHGMETISLRYFNVYGPRQNPNGPYAAVIPRFITAALRGAPLTIYGDGHQTRDFTYVADVVEANVLAMNLKTPPAGQAVNVACGRATPIWYLATAIASMVTGQENLTLDDVCRFAEKRVGDIEHSVARVLQLADVLKFDLLKATKLNEGLKPTVEWFKRGCACQATTAE